MPAQVIYQRTSGGVDDADATTPASAVRGTLFQGIKFFVAQRVPQRAAYIDKITSNGGEVVKLEKNAQLLIADHLRPNDAPPDALSYKYIDRAMELGRLPDPQEGHDRWRCGRVKGVARQVGTGVPTRLQKVPFTAEEDALLRAAVKGSVERGMGDQGNAVYMQIEAQNPRHTWQSWRARWVKTLRYREPLPQGASAAAAEQRPGESPQPAPSPAQVEAPLNETPTRHPPTPANVASEPIIAIPALPELIMAYTLVSKFNAEDVTDLLKNTPRILKTDNAYLDQAWAELARNWAGRHKGKEWQLFWEKMVLPIHNDIGGSKQREKTYNHVWKRWRRGMDNVSAEGWLQTYVKHVRTKFVDETEEPVGLETPVKQEQKPSFAAGLGGEGNETSTQKTTPSASTAGKRVRQEDDIDDSRVATSPLRKRSRVDAMRQNTTPSPRTLRSRNALQDNQQPTNVRPNGQTPNSASHGVRRSPRKATVLVSVKTSPQTRPTPRAQTISSDESATGESQSSSEGVQVAASSSLPQTLNGDGLAAVAAATQNLYDNILPPDEDDPPEDDEVGEMLSTPAGSQFVVPPHDDPSEDTPRAQAGRRRLDADVEMMTDTQAILMGETQDIDFGLAEPEGGFGDGLSVEDEDEDEDEEGEEEDGEGLFVHDEEEGRAGETPRLKLPPKLSSMAMDEDVEEQVEEDVGDSQGLSDGGVLPEVAELEAYIASHPSGELEDEEVEGAEEDDEDEEEEEEERSLEERMAAINVRARIQAGSKPADVVEAIKRTSAHPALFEVVLDSLESGNGVPSGMKGVWTEEEDEQAHGSNSRVLKRLEGKHGWDGITGVMGRLAFLAAFNKT